MLPILFLIFFLFLLSPLPSSSPCSVFPFSPDSLLIHFSSSPSPCRLEEPCLVRSGLVRLLDRLCSLVDNHTPLEEVGGEVGGGDEELSLHRVTSLAWAAFQVLADHCVSWENQDSAVLSSGLAKQVSPVNEGR